MLQFNTDFIGLYTIQLLNTTDLCKEKESTPQSLGGPRISFFLGVSEDIVYRLHRCKCIG